MMKCAVCNIELYAKTGEFEFKSRSLGKVLVPNITYFECDACGDKILSPKESDKLIDYVEKEENKAISKLPVSDFISANEAARILGITKQAFSKHPKIKRGLIYSVKIDDRKLYNRKSVEIFKEKGNGKYFLPKHEKQYLKPKKDSMIKFFSIAEHLPREKHYGAFGGQFVSTKYSLNKIFIVGRQ